jgi:hypothetical protein
MFYGHLFLEQQARFANVIRWLHEPNVSKVGDFDAAMIVSNCDTKGQTAGFFDRDAILKFLFRHLMVASYGRCHNNMTTFNHLGCENFPKQQKMCLIGRYKFYISIENSNSADYVTEKLYEPLLMGTIPIYLGADNVENFLPTSHTIIQLRDFKTPAELVAYVRCVASRPHLYNHYVNWRERPLFSSFHRILDPREAPLCRLCEELHRSVFDAGGRKRPATTGVDMEPRPMYAVLDENKGQQKPFPECVP